jgi:uncharacterized membrane protein
MRTPAQIAGHPIHPMLVTIPIGLWIFSLVCDFIARGVAAPETWQAASMYAMVGGILGALAAAVFGLADLLSLPAGPKSTAVKHMSLNLVIVVLYIINAWTRHSGAASAGMSLGLSIISILLLLVSGWLGGKMVFEEGVAVHAEGAGAAASGTWRADNRAWTGTGTARGERAMASDSTAPARDPLMPREERPAAKPEPGDINR